MQNQQLLLPHEQPNPRNGTILQKHCQQKLRRVPEDQEHQKQIYQIEL